MAEGELLGMVGRDVELARLHEFIRRGGRGRALLLSGAPGAGKTTLWEAAVEFARSEGARVLTARPSEAEARYSLSGLADLLHDVESAELDVLPEPLHTAVEVALLRAEPTGSPPEPRAIAAGIRSTLASLAGHGPLVVAVDDVQWLDPESAAALSFAARRLAGSDLVLVLALQAGSTSPVVRSAESLDIQRLELAGLSLGAVRRLLSARLGLVLPRRALRRLCEATQGNPLFALEIGRALVESGIPERGDLAPLPVRVDDLLDLRLEQLPAALREALLAIGLGGDLTPAQLTRIVPVEALDEAERSGILRVDAARMRAMHPLLAEAARSQASSGETRAMHLVLAGVLEDDALRERHLALGTLEADEELASRLDASARAAARRGAAVNAVELAWHAVRLTPVGSEARTERVLSLCEHMLVAGESDRAHALLEQELETLPHGAARARAHLMLADGRVTLGEMRDHFAHIELAASESGDDPALNAIASARKVRFTAVACVEQVPQADAWSLEALPSARAAGADVEREVLHALAWARVLQGKPIDDLARRFDTLSEDAPEVFRSLDRIQAERHSYRGEIRRAREILADLTAVTESRGEEWSYVWLRMNRCELELRAGEWDVAAHLLEAWEEDPNEALSLDPARVRCHALLAAGRGDAASCERHASRALTVESVWHLFEIARARAQAALLDGRPTDAIARLDPVWSHLEREGVDDPGVFPFAPDLVEALLEAGDHARAGSVTGRLGALAREQSHPWGLASYERSSALVRLAAGGERARHFEELESAAQAYQSLGLRFDRARTLLALGRAQRRARSRGAARRTLAAVSEAFEELGSPGWAALARDELGRISGRRAGAGELTPTERRVAELAGEGLSNKEIAGKLVVSVHTVEVHLSHAYRKLGVRSRAQLSRTLAAPSRL